MADVLVLEYNGTLLKYMVEKLEGWGYEAVGTNAVEKANTLVADAIEASNPFALACVDIDPEGTESFAALDLVRRLVDICPQTNVVVLSRTSDITDKVAFLSKLQGNVTIPCRDEMLRELANSYCKPRRNTLATQDREKMLFLWQVTAHCKGASSLTLFTFPPSVSEDDVGRNEKLDFSSSREKSKAQPIPSTCYRNNRDPERVIICPAPDIGCEKMCDFCPAWRGRTDAVGRPIPLVRHLQWFEMVSQVHHFIVQSKMAYQALVNGTLEVNFTGTGEQFSDNPDEICKAIEVLSKISGIRRFIITTIGGSQGLKRYIDVWAKRLEGIRVDIYWSVHNLVDKIRREYMSRLEKGEDDSIESMTELFAYVARLHGRPITINWMLMPGKNNRSEDASMIQKVNKRYPNCFNVKLMRYLKSPFPETNVISVPEPTRSDLGAFALVSYEQFFNTPKSLRDVPEPTQDDMETFREKLKELGVEVRIADHVGAEGALCGQTVPPQRSSERRGRW